MTLLADRTAELAACGERPVLQVLRGLESGLRGLTEGEASARLERDGENEIARPDAMAGHGLATAFRAPFLLVLIVLDVVLAISADLGGVLAITAMIVIAALMRFWQERRSRRTVDALRALVLTTATVVRRADADSEAIAREVPVDQLVVGDVVRLAAGDLIPADLRLLRSKDLFLDQSLLSGESMPVGKHAELSAGSTMASTVVRARPVTTSSAIATDTATAVSTATPTIAETAATAAIVDSHPSDHPALCLAGTHVLSGTATAVVIATGSRTYLASLGRELDRTRPATAFDRGVASVSWMLLRFMLLLAPLVFVVSGLATGSWHRAFLFAVAVAVGITPEMLPVVVTTTLARGAVTMARRRVIVKRLPAIQDLGAMDVLCVDKTGTLTEGAPALDRYTDAWGRVDETVLDYAALNSLFQSGWHNPLDEAVLAHADALALPADPAWDKIDEIPFDFSRRRMSVVVASTGGFGSEHVIITKGSVEEVVACCISVLDDGREVSLDADLRARIDEVTAAERDAGLQLLAVAVRSTGIRSGAFGASRSSIYTVADEADLTLVGLLGFTDPAKDTAVAALADLAARGVTVKVVTGDEPSAAARVCRDVGLDPRHGRRRPHHSSALDDDDLAALATATTVFAKTDPLAKARVVEALRRAGHTVGYLGDGINDAPALHAADVGISVARAADVAREAADVILLEKDLGRPRRRGRAKAAAPSPTP